MTFDESTVLELGAHGTYHGAPFRLAGRTCVRSDGGGLWNEWVLAFQDGSKKWLAEARGAFTLFDDAAIAPDFDALVVGGPLDTGFVVVERGKAERVATYGDVPAGPRTYRYADLSSRDGMSATIDFGDVAPRSFVGRRVRLVDLGLTTRVGLPRFVPAPDAPKPKHVELWLAVGDEGRLEDATFRVLGILARSLKSGGTKYTWEEYLLHEPSRGFRWLVVADGHWNLVETIEPGLVEETKKSASYDGETYRPFSSGRARVEWAAGELPWEVAIGDTTDVHDYVRAPYMLSRESTPDEITWSRSKYLPPDAVSRAFRKRALPKPKGRAPNQPKSRPRS